MGWGEGPMFPCRWGYGLRQVVVWVEGGNIIRGGTSVLRFGDVVACFRPIGAKNA